jgi:methylamine dehydrogenase accessory protein MauD
MNTYMLVSSSVLWITLLFLAFLLLGALRSLAILSWRLDQLEATIPSRMGRSGLKPGRRAPDFTLPSVAGQEVSLREFAGQPVLLVFMQPGCGPCQALVPELNRVGQRSGGPQVLVVNNGAPDAARRWAEESGARIPVLVQDAWQVSKRYEAFATPFGFLIDEQGVITSAGLVGNRQQLQFVLSGAGRKTEPGAVARSAPREDAAVPAPLVKPELQQI